MFLPPAQAQAAETSRRSQGYEAANQLLHFQNALLIGLPFSTIAPLQRVQNAAARLLLGLSRRDHVRPAQKELHWLPVVYRIQFKVALVMFTIHTHRCPDYLGDSVHACNSDPARTRLRSVSSSDYTVPRTRTKGVFPIRRN